jgi:uncharacterized protein (UPF0303 family)
MQQARQDVTQAAHAHRGTAARNQQWLTRRYTVTALV